MSFFGLALAAIFVVAASVQQAFADSAPAVAQSFPGPAFHHREMGDSLSMASTIGGLPAAQSFSRSISDNVGLTTSFGPPQFQTARAPVDNTAFRSSQYYPGSGKRMEERLNFKNHANNRGRHDKWQGIQRQNADKHGLGIQCRQYICRRQSCRGSRCCFG